MVAGWEETGAAGVWLQGGCRDGDICQRLVKGRTVEVGRQVRIGKCFARTLVRVWTTKELTWAARFP